MITATQSAHRPIAMVDQLLDRMRSGQMYPVSWNCSSIAEVTAELDIWPVCIVW